MDITRVFYLTKSNFKVFTRVRQSFFFSMIFPLIFIGLFGLAFQEGDPGNTTISILLQSEDTGIPYQLPLVEGNNLPADYYSKQFLTILENITFEDGKTPIFSIEQRSASEFDKSIIDVEKRKYKALVILDEDFSLAVLSARKLSFEQRIPEINWSEYPEKTLTDIRLKGDPSLIAYSITSQVFDVVIDSYFSMSADESTAVLLRESLNSDGLTTFDLVVPGLVIFAIINNLGTTAGVAVRDVAAGQLDRLRLTKMKNTEYIISIILSQMMMASLQIPIMFGTAMLFGFPMTLGIFLSGFLLSLLVNIAITGMGVMLAGLSSDPSAVGGLAAIIGTPMAFMAGAFFSMPNPILIAEGGLLGENSFRLFDILPPTKAITAMRLLLVGRELSDVWFELLVTAILSVIYLSLGILIYSKKNLKPK